MMVPARAEHVAYVFARLSAQTKAEMAVVGWSAERLLDEYMDFSLSGEAFAFLHNGEPGCLIAFACPNEMVVTFLIGAAGFFERSAAHRRELRAFMRGRVEEYGSIVTMSSSPDRNLARWMAMLGAQQVGEIEDKKIFLWA